MTLRRPTIVWHRVAKRQGCRQGGAHLCAEYDQGRTSRMASSRFPVDSGTTTQSGSSLLSDPCTVGRSDVCVFAEKMPLSRQLRRRIHTVIAWRVLSTDFAHGATVNIKKIRLNVSLDIGVNLCVAPLLGTDRRLRSKRRVTISIRGLQYITSRTSGHSGVIGNVAVIGTVSGPITCSWVRHLYSMRYLFYNINF